MIASAIAAAFYEAIEKALNSFIGEGGRDLSNRLHVGLGGNESAESGRAIRTLADAARAEPGVADAIEAGAPLSEILSAPGFAVAFGEVIRRFGHRAPAELELSNPSWRAEPQQVLDVVRIELHRPAHADGASAIREEAEGELDRRVKGVKRRIVGALLGARSRRLMGLRENGKVPAVKVFDDTRRLLAAVAPTLIENGTIPDAGAIHFLRYQELRDVLRGAPGPGVDEVDRRREQHARCLELDLPELIEAGPGWIRPLDDAFFVAQGDAAADRVERRHRHADRDRRQPRPHHRHGAACCSTPSRTSSRATCCSPRPSTPAGRPCSRARAPWCSTSEASCPTAPSWRRARHPVRRQRQGRHRAGPHRHHRHRRRLHRRGPALSQERGEAVGGLVAGGDAGVDAGLGEVVAGQLDA